MPAVKRLEDPYLLPPQWPVIDGHPKIADKGIQTPPCTAHTALHNLFPAQLSSLSPTILVPCAQTMLPKLFHNAQ